MEPDTLFASRPVLMSFISFQVWIPDLRIFLPSYILAIAEMKRSKVYTMHVSVV